MRPITALCVMGLQAGVEITWRAFQVPDNLVFIFLLAKFPRMLVLNGTFDVAAHIIQNASFTADFDMSLNECIFAALNGNTI